MAALLGPTASGKSSTALLVAERAGAEIVSVDSMQVYRGMDIGTAKPDAEDLARVPHHMIDLANPGDPYSVAQFQQTGRAVLADLAHRDVPALIVGGSGLHFRSLIDPLEFPPSDPDLRREVEALGEEGAVAALLEVDPSAADHVDLANPRRVTRALEIHRLTGATPSVRAALPEAAAVRDYEPLVVFVAGLFDAAEALPVRVEVRFDRMLEQGLLEEVAALADRLGPTASQAVGYKQLLPVTTGHRTLAEGRRRAIDSTRALAGRQRTFFGRDPRPVPLEWHDDVTRRAGRLQALFEEAGWTS